LSDKHIRKSSLHIIVGAGLILLQSILPDSAAGLSIVWVRDIELLSNDRSPLSLSRFVKDSEDNYIIAGHIRVEPRFYSQHISIGKLNSEVDSLLWARDYGLPGLDSVFYAIREVLLIDEDGIIVTGEYGGSINDDPFGIYAISVDSEGDSIWTFRIETESSARVRDIVAIPDEGYVIGARGRSYEEHRNSHILFIKLNLAGELVDVFRYSRADSTELGISSMLLTADGNLAVCGGSWTYYEGKRYPFWRGMLSIFDLDGELIWLSELSDFVGGHISHHGYFQDMIQRRNGDFVMCGNTTYRVDNPDYKFWLLAADEEGNCDWSRTYDCDEELSGSAPLKYIFEADRQFVCFAYYQDYALETRRPYVMVTDENGRFVEDLLFPEEHDRRSFKDVKETDEGEYVCRIGSWNLVKVTLREDYVKPETELPLSLRIISAYPNPFNTQARFVYSLPYSTSYSLYLYDHAGRFVRSLSSGYGAAGVHHGWLDAGSLPSGNYYIRLLTPDGTMTSPIVITK